MGILRRQDGSGPAVALAWAALLILACSAEAAAAAAGASTGESPVSRSLEGLTGASRVRRRLPPPPPAVRSVRSVRPAYRPARRGQGPVALSAGWGPLLDLADGLRTDSAPRAAAWSPADAPLLTACKGVLKNAAAGSLLVAVQCHGAVTPAIVRSLQLDALLRSLLRGEPLLCEQARGRSGGVWGDFF